VGTKEFADAVVLNLGQKPAKLKPVNYSNGAALNLPKYVKKAPKIKELVGVDVFVHWNGTDADKLAVKIQELNSSEMELSMITNRGIKVWPNGFSETFCTDHWRCRFKPTAETKMNKAHITSILNNATDKNIDTIKTENLYNFDGKAGFSLGQGQ
jgi:isocitrate dehydrogenase